MYDLVWQNQTLWKRYAGSELIPPPPKDAAISKVALLLWEDHCVECAAPACYSSCHLYVPRRDKKCTRFVYGIVPNAQVTGLFNYGADIFVRRWGKIEANWYGTPQMFSIEKVRKYDQWAGTLAALANALPDALQQVTSKRHANEIYTILRSKWIERRFVCYGPNVPSIDGFYIKFFYPDQEEQELQIEFFQEVPVYRTAISVTPGWNQKFIPVSAMNIVPDRKGRISLCASNDKEIRLVFTWLDFVKLDDIIAHEPDKIIDRSTLAARPAPKVKCLVWDLDDTLWEGLIGEVGPENVKPNENAIDLIKKLDERGIVQSIASKNTYDVAWAKVEELGLADYFLYPAIHWGPKSESLRAIATALNINVDTLALIDDSPFERSETLAVLPQVRVYDPTTMDKLLHREEFSVPITEASRQRRLSYRSEVKRKQIAAKWSDNYEGFLRSCDMVIRVGVPKAGQKDRCLELIQRTNQLNLSGRHYSAEEFDRLLACEQAECYVFDCSDKFGDYGVVGFATIDVTGPAPTIKDFVLSCRVAQKRVEETFIYWYARKAQQQGAQRLIAALVVTERNAPLRDVLDKLPFRRIARDGDNQLFEFVFEGPVPLPDIIRIEEVLT